MSSNVNSCDNLVTELSKQLIEKTNSYMPIEEKRIIRAYNYANGYHYAQKRNSGEPFITHPLNVALILAQMHADGDTICGALLHDVLEDTSALEEEILKLFGKTVLTLVQGVTKIDNISFTSKEEEKAANEEKLLKSCLVDIRILIIKLADRLHNMRTLNYKNSFKQKEKALETLEIYSRIAGKIGAYRIMKELQDLSFKYLKPTEYNDIYQKREFLKETHLKDLIVMQENVYKTLYDLGVNGHFRIKFKDIFGIHLKLAKGIEFDEIHDIMIINILVNKIEECYKALMAVHMCYKPENKYFKDFVFNPKTNMYQSIHTTVNTPFDHLVQFQLKTYDMATIASYGLSAYWILEAKKANQLMQEKFQSLQFYEELLKLREANDGTKEFAIKVKEELLTRNIYVKTPNGFIVELPVDATPIDFAFKIHSDIGSKMDRVLINGVEADKFTRLQNDDRITIIAENDGVTCTEEWLSYAKTSYARKKIRQFVGK
ncbi:MAG: bifunctional (p)ppGpp synthetase/guanosine-3',5'-bis(diphosphate) 3'-pyrophosphohydrolase [Bacilli bacterium]|nr:bifunctional (p)ppGpp synthetase/guanosine-3',5'-bis(diphosphate) 3'-pyrophosphohydrolase [Bacilli bacterium]